jgi:IclR family transcriptional regulator, pca regulon regulatory protein
MTRKERRGMHEQDRPITPSDRDFVSALASGLAVMRAFDADHPRMTLSEVADRTGTTRAKARRFLLTLHALGYVRKQGRHFEPSPRVLQLGYAYLSANPYRGLVQQVLEEITEQSGESSSLGVLDGDEVVYLARSSARHRLMAITLSVGTRLPASHTSIGRVLLAGLPAEALEDYLARVTLSRHTPHSITEVARLRTCLEQVHRQGYALVDQELDSGLRSLAVPVTDAGGESIGAINISTNAARVELDTLLSMHLPLLQAKALRIRTATG